MWGNDPVWLIFLKGGWNHQIENNGWAVRIVMRVHFCSLDDHFPDPNWRAKGCNKVGLPGILNHYQEGRNCRMANKKEMLTLQTHSGSIYSWFIWSDQPLVDDDHRLVGRFCLASFFSCKIYKSKLERRKPQGQLLRIHPVRYILKSWRIWRMDTLQGLRQKPVRVGKQASQFYIPSASKIYLHSPLWTSLSKIEWTRKMMGFVKGNAFQRYGYLRVSGHDFTPKMLGLPLQTHKLTSKKKKSRQKFPGWWFQIFFYPTWGNDPIWLTIFSNGLKPATRF